MVVGNDSYFVPTSQLPTNQEGFIIKKVLGENSRVSKNKSAHVCRFSLYKLATFNQIDMKTICEIVRKEDEDQMNPLLPSDFILFPPKQETPPAFVTYNEIQIIMDDTHTRES